MTRTINDEVTKQGGAVQRISPFTILACSWPALVLATACLLPYLNKPFLIDDPHFLTMARQIVKHPMHPMDFEICWDTIEGCTKAYNLTPGNALMGYVLVPTIMAGAPEWMAHLEQLVLVWIAILAMASLVFRFGWGRRHAIAGTLLLVAIPPFLHMASTAMPDILATTVTLVAMERVAAWKAEQRWQQGVAAGFALGLAGFARTHLVLLLPIAAIFLLDSISPKAIVTQLRRRYWLWAPVWGGVGLLASIILTTREHNLGIAPPPVVVGAQYIRINLYSYLVYFVFPIPLGACWLLYRFKNRQLGTSLITCAVLLISALLHWRIPMILYLVFWASVALADLLLEACRVRDPTRLSLILWVLIPLPIIYYVHLPIKYLLPCIPAVILICLRMTEEFSSRFMRIATVALIAASSAYSVLILRSDAQFAEFGRSSMYHLISPHIAAGEKVWFGGQYWSYWYAPLAGATLAYPGGPQPNPGDLLVVGSFGGGGPHSPLERFPRRTLVEAVSEKHQFGRIYNGLWLWGFGEAEVDRYELWRID